MGTGSTYMKGEALEDLGAAAIARPACGHRQQ